MKDLFCTDGIWLKGNLHMHTTNSDGCLSPDAALKVYRDAGYDFVALTDHWVQGENGVRNGIMVLNGCEWDVGDSVRTPVYHILGIGMERAVTGSRKELCTPQAIIDAVNAAGGLAVLAHPAWSLTDPDEAMKLHGLAGAEIYNSVSTLPWNGERGDASLYFDLWAAKGRMVRCFAADDAHYYHGEQAHSFLMVRAKDCTADSVKSALRKGDFYASQGPRFTAVRTGGGKVEAEFTGASTAVFYSNTVWCDDRVALNCGGSASYRVKPTDRYVRIELIDGAGNKAWSSPFAVNGTQACS